MNPPINARTARTMSLTIMYVVNSIPKSYPFSVKSK